MNPNHRQPKLRANGGHDHTSWRHQIPQNVVSRASVAYSSELWSVTFFETPRVCFFLTFHIAAKLRTNRYILKVRPTSYNRDYRFLGVGFGGLNVDQHQRYISMQRTLHFNCSSPSSAQPSADLSSFCSVEYTAGTAAAEAMAADANWEELVSGQGGEGPSSGFHENIPASKYHAASALQLISFNPPLLISNLLAVPLTYRLRGSSKAWADGQLPVGKGLACVACPI